MIPSFATMTERVYRLVELSQQTYPSRDAAIARIGELIATLTGKVPITPALGFYSVQEDGTCVKLDMARIDNTDKFDVLVTKTRTCATETESTALQTKLTMDNLLNPEFITPDTSPRVTYRLEKPLPTTTLALIKPGAFAKKDQVLKDIESAGFQILSQATVKGGIVELWEEFYKEHANQPFYQGLNEHMTSGPTLALELTCKDARDADVITKWCDVIGATDCSTGLRREYGMSPPDNALHGSDSRASLKREMALFAEYF